MKLFERLGSIYVKLISTYIIIIIFTASVLGVVSYKFFSSNFDNEVKSINFSMLENISKIVDESIVKKVEQIYISFAVEGRDAAGLLSVFNREPDMNHAKLYETYQNINSIVTLNSDLISSIDIYSKNSSVIISSLYGIKYISDDSTDLSNFGWISTLEKSNKSSLWFPTYKDENVSESAVNIFTWAVTYPMASKGNSDGAAAIHIREDALHEYIKQTEKTDSKYFILSDENGSIISHSRKEMLYEKVQDKTFFVKILNSNKVSDFFITDIDGKKAAVSYVTFESNGWKLINITSVEEFYRKSNYIQRILIIISLAIIFVGILISGLFTRHMYNPVKVLLNRVSSLFTGNEPRNRRNEYALIDSAINMLSDKVVNLQATVEENKPLIKHNLIIRLLNNTLRNENELKELMRLAGLTFDSSAYRTAIIEFSEEHIHNISIENSQFMKYNLIQFITSCSNKNMTLVATELSDYQIAVAISSEAGEEFIESLLKEISAYISESYKVDHVISAGQEVGSILHLNQSYEMAKISLKYKYFMPEVKLFLPVRINPRETSKDEMPDAVFEEIRKGLNVNDRGTVKEQLEQFKKHVQNGNYSVEYCHQKLMDILLIFSHYIKGLGFSTQDIMISELYEEFKRINNINQFQDWFIELYDRVSVLMEDRLKNRNADIIEKVKDYISEHLDKDLSLDLVADKVYLSSRYLSKVFKEQTGVNFTDYIVKKRIEKARNLLKDTDLNVKEIGERVGFNSSAYFIKKYREVYGITPRTHKQQDV